MNRRLPGARRLVGDDAVLSVVPVLVAVTPMLFAGIRAAVGPWVPIGDDAYFTARSLDVATEQHPLLGAWSAGSLDVGKSVNNLGPIQLDLLAPFTRFTPMGGTAIGVITVHIAAIITIAWVINRIAGPRYIVVAMSAISILGWTLGSEKLITPQQHQYLLLPYLCVLVAAWAVASGDRWALVPAVFFASLAVQTHLSYPILIAALGVPMLIGEFAHRRDAAHDARGRSITPLIVSAILAAVLWVQTAIEQFTGSGNFVNVLTSNGSAESPGLSTATRIVADVLLAPRGYIRPGYGEYDPDTSLANGAQVAMLLIVVVALSVGAVVAYRRDHRVTAAGCAVAVTALASAIADASVLPITENFDLLESNYRWLWPIGTLLLIGFGCALVRFSGPHGGAVVVAVGAVVLAVASVANLATSYQVAAPDKYAAESTSTQRMVEQLDDVDLDGPVVIDQSNMYFTHPYTYPILVVLRSRGIDYRFDSPLQARRFGADRVSDGSEEHELVLWFGDDARDRRDDADTVVFVEEAPVVALTLTER